MTMRVTMSGVWDRTSEVLAQRQAPLGLIAAASLWLPAVIQQALTGATLGEAPPAAAGGAAAGAGGLVALLVALVGLWGKLALVAVASEPGATARGAWRLAGRRLPAMVGLSLLVVLGVILLAVPLMVAMAPYTAAAALAGADGGRALFAAMPAGRRDFLIVYVLGLAIALLCLFVRLCVLNPVVVNEARGIGSFRRSLEVTRGHFWQLLGVTLLFGLVIWVAVYATQTVVGTVAALLIGTRHAAAVALVTTIFTAAVGAVGSVVALVFTAQFYDARRDQPMAGR
jgi:hypothetical protein